MTFLYRKYLKVIVITKESQKVTIKNNIEKKEAGYSGISGEISLPERLVVTHDHSKAFSYATAGRRRYFAGSRRYIKAVSLLFPRIFFLHEADVVQIRAFTICIFQLDDVFSSLQRENIWFPVVASDREQRPFIGRFSEAAAAREGEDADVPAIDCQSAPRAIRIAVTGCEDVVSVGRN